VTGTRATLTVATGAFETSPHAASATVAAAKATKLARSVCHVIVVSRPRTMRKIRPATQCAIVFFRRGINRLITDRVRAIIAATAAVRLKFRTPLTGLGMTCRASLPLIRLAASRLPTHRSMLSRRSPPSQVGRARQRQLRLL
jgi:hypothetical protein